MNPRFGRPRHSADDTSGTPLEGLLAEMRELRLTLAADLNAAAGAAEAGAEDVAADILEADRTELALFSTSIDERLLGLHKLVAPAAEAPRWRRRVVVALPVVPIVGALAVSAAAATGVLPVPHPAAHHATPPAVAVQTTIDRSPVNSSFLAFADVVGSDPSASQVIAAAHRLHKQLAQLIATSPDDPGSAEQIAELLRMEQSLLIREQPPGASVVLDATRKLAKRLVNITPQIAPTVVPTELPTFAPTQQPHRASTSPTPTKTAKPSPTPTHTTSPRPSSSPSSTPSGPILIP